MIRSYQSADSTPLSLYHNAIYPERPFTPTTFHQFMQTIQHAGGQSWVITEEETAVGYAAISPVPGLPHIADLHGLVAPHKQRRGFGSQLLNYLITQLPNTLFYQLSHPVPSLGTPAALFLLHHHFSLEHTEQTLQLPLPPHSSPLSPRLSPLTFQHYSRPRSILLFLTLYDQSFGGMPWYQPYTAQEVRAILQDPADLLFLLSGEKPIGFAWLHSTGEIEPIGIIQREQGKGYGRFLLRTAIERLARRGCSHARLTVWENNVVALHLYKSLGFQPVETRYYLAYNSHDA